MFQSFFLHFQNDRFYATMHPSVIRPSTCISINQTSIKNWRETKIKKKESYVMFEWKVLFTTVQWNYLLLSFSNWRWRRRAHSHLYNVYRKIDHLRQFKGTTKWPVPLFRCWIFDIFYMQHIQHVSKCNESWCEYKQCKIIFLSRIKQFYLFDILFTPTRIDIISHNWSCIEYSCVALRKNKMNE